jgi:hypothetical protein
VSSGVAGGACSFANRACLHFSNASFLASAITYGLRGLPDFASLTGATAAGVTVPWWMAVCRTVYVRIADEKSFRTT